MRKKFKYSFLLLLWCCLVCGLTAQRSNTYQQLSKKDGLSQSSVFAITQDSEGFMWFGTRDGLNKYDGYQIKVFKNHSDKNSIVSNDIRHLYFDKYHNELWIGTNNGLSKYTSTVDSFTNYRHLPSDTTSISNDIIHQIYRDTKGRLWIATSHGINLYLDDKKEFYNILITEEHTTYDISQSVKAILEDSSGKMWIGTTDGLYLFSYSGVDQYSFVRIDDSPTCQLSDTNIKCLLEDPEGNFWIGTVDGGINYWNKKEETVTIYGNEKNNPHSLSHNNIRSICLDKDDNLWVGTFDGLNFLKKNTQSFVRYSKSKFGISGLSDKSIRSLYIDKRGSLWAGTYYGGINLLDDNYNLFSNYKHSAFGNTLSGNVISSFAEEENGNLWIGTEGDGLNYYDRKQNKFSTYEYKNGENSIGSNNIKQLLIDGDKLWIGTFQGGLNVLNKRNGQFKKYTNDPLNDNSLSNNNVYGIHKEGDNLWILTYGGGLDILSIKENKFYNYNNIPNDNTSLSSALTRVILKTRRGQIWIGTENGINKVSVDEKGMPSAFETFLSHEKIYCLQEDSDGNIWVGTYTNGMYSFNPETNIFQHYTTNDGLPGNTVFGIIETDNNILWMSTNDGLTKFDPKLKKFLNYNYSNGIENSEYNYNAYYKTSNGDLLFGGVNGFTKFDPKSITRNKFIPSVAFTELRINNEIVHVGDETGILTKSLNYTEAITFNYNEANFSISFASLDYISPANNHYAFVLEGIDKQWKSSKGKTEATYTLQKSGDYIFKMKGGNSEGLFNPEIRQLKIRVLPPPWRTLWAYLLYLLAIVLISLAIIRYIRLNHKLQLEQIEKQKQEELHEVKLRFFTNITHEFRTPLTLILAPLNDLINKEKHTDRVRGQLKSIERNGQRMLNLVNQILTFRKLASDHSSLKIVRGDIVSFLREIYLLFQDTADRRQIDYTFESEDKEIEAWFDQDKLEKVFYNLLSNAFKFTPETESISMVISQTKRDIQIRIIDTGIGVEPEYRDQIFKRFYEKSNNKPSTIKGTGIGLSISKQMVELHNGDICVEEPKSTLTKGTTFLVQIPKGNAHFNDTEDISNMENIGDYHPISASYQDLSEPDDHHETTEAERSLLLVVEDNAEVRSYIKKIFLPDYDVITAENGLIGLQKAKAHLPQLIISDIMMPEMDGIALCSQLKKDIEISHIPVILLTARTASLFKIEGLETGADDYITKPFVPDELRLRVRNIIKTREKVRDKFIRVLNFDPNEISITSADEVFIEKALQVVEKEIDNHKFNVNQFAYDLAVSRPLLFTKLKALTGQTPNNFIKTIRLKRASQLLKTKKLNVSEVAYKVGFRDTKYFSRCFKEHFSQSPTEYKESN